MNKPKMSLYGVQVYGQRFSPPCVFCGKGKNTKCIMGVFYYHDKVEGKAIKYTVKMCRDCFDINIKNKPLSKLYSLPSLLKMKGKDVDREERDLHVNRLEPVCFRPNRINPVLPEFYGKWISEKDKEAYSNEVFKYTTILFRGSLNE